MEFLLYLSPESAEIYQIISRRIPLGIADSKINLSSRRNQDVESAVKISGSKVRQIEREAFWMEDKPNEVKYAVKKYCF